MWRREVSRFYLLIAALCVGSWVWLVYNYQAGSHAIGICIFRQLTSVPCPACGTTRSVIELSSAHWLNAWHINPFGYFAAAMLFIIPVWLIIDILTKKHRLYNYYKQFDIRMKQQPVWLVIIALIICSNWIWNICKI